MPFLVELQQKMGSVRNTRKITKAMELVAASRMKQFQRKASGSRTYAWSLLRALEQDVASVRETAYGAERTEGFVLFVLLTSDKGLCGALNQQLLRALWRSPRWTSLSAEHRRLFTIGKKGTEAAAHQGVPVIGSADGLKEQLTVLEAMEVIDQILGYWDRGEAREIVLVAPHYVNPFVFHAQLKTYLPFSEAMIAEQTVHAPEEARTNLLKTGVAFHEPDQSRVRDVLAQQLIESLFLQAFFELKATEYSSRMVAMKNASTAADELLKQLSLAYNKARQGAITQQLAELTGGSLALES
mgnify:CR=1 FL=1